MQSLHICRTELLAAQKNTSRHLDHLLKLNPLAQSLRQALRVAQAELAAAVASKNPFLASRSLARISSIKKQQQALDRLQRSFLSLGDLEMNKGLSKVIRSLRQQNQDNQGLLTGEFRFRIYRIRTLPRKIAVLPDRPETAPVYELKKNFSEEQALNVSWTSEFESSSNKRSQWILNHHKRDDSCGASLLRKDDKFRPILKEGKSFSRL